MQKDLKEAVQAESLTLFFQPKVDKNLKIIGAEGLVRWQRGHVYEVLPSEFIEVAEESNLILPLGTWVFKKACEQLKLWLSNPAFNHLSLSINISA